jgi:hypothetical protein
MLSAKTLSTWQPPPTSLASSPDGTDDRSQPGRDRRPTCRCTRTELPLSTTSSNPNPNRKLACRATPSSRCCRRAGRGHAYMPSTSGSHDRGCGPAFRLAHQGSGSVSSLTNLAVDDERSGAQRVKVVTQRIDGNVD